MNKPICKFGEALDGLIAEFAQKHLVGAKILELGCGSGGRTKLFHTISDRVIGIDIVDRVEDEHKSHFQFLLADARELPFKDNAFDAVVSFDVIEHIDDEEAFIAEAFRVLRKGKWLLLGTPNRLRLSNRLKALWGRKITYPYYLGSDTIHLREYVMDDLIALVEKGGFIRIKPMHIWVGLVGRINLGLRKSPWFLNSYAQYLLVVAHKQ